MVERNNYGMYFLMIQRMTEMVNLIRLKNTISLYRNITIYFVITLFYSSVLKNEGLFLLPMGTAPF